MPKIVLVLACLVSAGHGKRVRVSDYQHPKLRSAVEAGESRGGVSGKIAFTPFDALAILLLALNPSAVFNPSAPGQPGHTLLGSRSKVHRLGVSSAAMSDAAAADDDAEEEPKIDDTLLLNPAAALQRWREERINLFGSVLDCSRYHVQVLIVDDDALRARTCEAMLEKVALWADAGWWIYPHSTSLGSPVYDLDDRTRLSEICAPFKLSKQCLSSATSEFDVNDVLDGTYDLVVCVDVEVQEKVRSLVKQAVANDPAAEPDATVLSLCDFLAIGGNRLDTLDEELSDLVASQYFKGLPGLMELPRAYTSQKEEWSRILAACALSCAGMTTYLKDLFDNYVVTAFNDLLEAHYRRAEHLNVSWDECERAMRRHIVTGGLTIQQRQELFEAHQTKLRTRLLDKGEI